MGDFVPDEFAAAEGASAPSDKLDALNKLLDSAIEWETVVERLEEDLKVAKKAAHALKSNRIPDLMAEIGIDAIVFRGWKVKVEDFVSGSLPKDPEKREAAIAWLRSVDAEALVRTQVALSFGAGENAEAEKLVERLRAEGLEVEADRGVNSQTLCAFARERIRNGEPVDAEALGLYIGRVAKMKGPKP